MDRTEAYVNELNRLKQDAAKLVDAIKGKDSEILVENAVKLAFEEMRTIYIREAESLIDAIAQRKVNEIESEESGLLRTGVKGACAGLAGWLAGRQSGAGRFAPRNS
jgi:alpha-N-acetylglucosamine transferase